LHIMFEIAFDHAWLAGKDFPRSRGRALVRLLEALARAAGGGGPAPPPPGAGPGRPPPPPPGPPRAPRGPPRRPPRGFRPRSGAPPGR
jgi:hypothetical protein